jgi:hypothetical protein
MLDFYQSDEPCECCESLALPIEECHRDDVAGFEADKGANLWCCACGRFWTGTEDELKAARVRAEE